MLKSESSAEINDAEMPELDPHFEEDIPELVYNDSHIQYDDYEEHDAINLETEHCIIFNGKLYPLRKSDSRFLATLLGIGSTMRQINDSQDRPEDSHQNESD